MALAAVATEVREVREARTLVRYDLLLLHGEPVEVTESLPAEIDEGAPVEVRGQEWTVAAIRRDRPDRPQLVCLRGL